MRGFEGARSAGIGNDVHFEPPQFLQGMRQELLHVGHGVVDFVRTIEQAGGVDRDALGRHPPELSLGHCVRRRHDQPDPRPPAVRPFRLVGCAVAHALVPRRNLRQFDQNVAGRFRIDEGDAAPAMTGAGFLVQQLDALGLQLIERTVDVVDLEA